MLRMRDFWAFIENLAIEDKMREASKQYIYSVVRDYDKIMQIKSKFDGANDELAAISLEFCNNRSNENKREQRRVEAIQKKASYLRSLRSSLFFVNDYKKRTAFLNKKTQKILGMFFFKRKSACEIAKKLNMSKMHTYRLMNNALLCLYYQLDEEYKRMVK